MFPCKKKIHVTEKMECILKREDTQTNNLYPLHELVTINVQIFRVKPFLKYVGQVYKRYHSRVKIKIIILKKVYDIASQLCP
jgi:hypothetical protein